MIFKTFLKTKISGFRFQIYYNPDNWFDFWFTLRIHSLFMLASEPVPQSVKRALIDVSYAFSKEKYLNWRYGRIESKVVQDEPHRTELIEILFDGKIYPFVSGVLIKSRPRGGPKEITSVWIGEVSGHPAVISQEDDLVETIGRLIEERVVQPSFSHDVELPVMGSLKVNLDKIKATYDRSY